MAAKRGLGRGLGALISDQPSVKTTQKKVLTPATSRLGAQEIPLNSIRRNPWQPRRVFNEEALTELADSIREMGIIQPLLVRPLDDGAYELIAGERRMTAAQRAGLIDVPVIIREITDQESAEIALVENLQREDLNPIEEAEGYQRLTADFKLTQEEIAQRCGKARTSVSNSMRLLQLSDPLRQMISNQQLSAGHAKVLLGVEDESLREKMAKRIAREGLSVRAIEKLAAKAKAEPKKPAERKSDLSPALAEDIATRLQNVLGSKVQLVPAATLPNGKRSKGKIEIDIYTNDDIDKLLQLLGLNDDL